MKPNLPPINCPVAPIDILLYVTGRHYRHYHSLPRVAVAVPDCEQHYQYLMTYIHTYIYT